MELAKEYDLHHKIKLKLNHFIETNKIPHIIFYGPNGSGKKTLLLEPIIRYNFTTWVSGNIHFTYTLIDDKVTGKTENKDFGFFLSFKIKG